jgi:hypothetical protein
MLENLVASATLRLEYLSSIAAAFFKYCNATNSEENYLAVTNIVVHFNQHRTCIHVKDEVHLCLLTLVSILC